MVGRDDADALRRRVRGEVVSRADAGYDEARHVWNGVIDRRPSAIVRCVATDDVVEAVRFARERGLAIAVRGGGHHVAGTGTVDDGLVIDLGAMRGVRVDPDARIAVVAGGATLGDVDRATQAHGLATPLGVVSETGVGGLTLSGGIGWLRRAHGLSCDNLVAAEVVTAEGEVVRTSDDERPGLLWGLRGGGGNFGVVTSFTFALHPVGPDVALAFTLFPGARAAEVLEGCAAALDDLGEGVAPLAFLGRVPADEAFPEAIHGEPFVAVMAVHPAVAEVGAAALAPLRSIAEPLADLSDTMPYVEAQSALDEEYPSGRRYYWKSTELADLGAAVEVLERHAAAAPSDLSTVDVWFHGGAMAAVAPDATAYGDRSAPILIGVEANWETAADDERNIAWARALVDDLAPYSTGRTYLNFPGFHEDPDRQLRSTYGSNYERLAALKAAYDPDNVFRLNQNVPPAGG
jgi:FAD/FMN-containing dehydrogenase